MVDWTITENHMSFVIWLPLLAKVVIIADINTKNTPQKAHSIKDKLLACHITLWSHYIMALSK